jgi:parvulin-like peptidyl-prolyl isomerase
VSKLRDKKALAVVFGGLLIVGVAAIAVFGDVGKASVPDDAIIVVEGEGEISQEELDASIAQAAASQGLPQAPAEDDPQYEAVRDQALNELLDQIWILGEAERRGITATDTEVQREFERTKSQSFKTEKEYQDFLKESGFTQEDIDERVRLQVVSTKIEDQIKEDAGTVSEEDAQAFYDANKEQFEQPASRDIRIVLTKDEAQAQQAFDQLSADNSPESWNKVAAEFSTDASSKDKGGVREAVTEGVFTEPFNGEVFGAEEAQVLGPIETPEGFYVFQVDTITDTTALSLEEARTQQIDQQLAGQQEQELFTAFLSDYRDYWTARTICADDFEFNRCDNFPGERQACDLEEQEEQQAAVPEEQRSEPSCPAPVFSAGTGGGPTPIGPGQFDPFVPAQGQPQRPHGPGEDAAEPAAGGLPGGLPGAVPGAPGGATAPPPQ